MLQHIPTHVISGTLGAGKTSVLRSLLAQRPEHERWAVLINEFGEIGLDSALLDGEQEGVSFTEVALTRTEHWQWRNGLLPALLLLSSHAIAFIHQQ